jgi:hypothetical protein
MHGRRVVAYRLVDRDDLRDFAARCGYAMSVAVEIAAATGRRYAGIHWRMVPDVVPRAWPAGARRCPRCGCTPDKPCAITLPDELGAGSCVPAGVHAFASCTGCVMP